MIRFIISFVLFFSATLSYANQQLIIEPDMGQAPILQAIAQSKSDVDLVMYGFTDLDFANALIKAKNDGKKVRVLLQHYPYRADDENQKAINLLRSANINLVWPDNDFKLTHQKTLLLDHNKAIVMTFNLTHSTFKNERNFALVVTDPESVQEIQNVFNEDWQHHHAATQQTNLVWSPDNSREKLIDLINSARSSIKIYAEGLNDYQTVGALAKAARHGVRVQILTSPPRDNQAPNKKFDYLRRAGVDIQFDKEFWIHAKVIIIDETKAVMGSINLTRASMNDNRELSVITEDPGVLKQLNQTFTRDWTHAGGGKSFSFTSPLVGEGEAYTPNGAPWMARLGLEAGCLYAQRRVRGVIKILSKSFL